MQRKKTTHTYIYQKKKIRRKNAKHTGFQSAKTKEAKRVFFLSLEEQNGDAPKCDGSKKTLKKKQTKSEERTHRKRQNLKHFDRVTDIFFQNKKVYMKRFFTHFDKI